MSTHPSPCPVAPSWPPPARARLWPPSSGLPRPSCRPRSSARRRRATASTSRPSASGRISRDHDMPETLVFDSARIMAVCDLDRRRLEDGKRFVNDFYAKQSGSAYDGVTMYDDYRELLANQRHRRRADQHARPLARADRDRGRRGRQGRLPAEARVAHHRRGTGACPTPCSAPAACCNSGARTGHCRSTATPANWCATAASGN